MMTTLQLNNMQMSVLATILSVANIIFCPLSAFLSNRYSTKNLICITLLGFVATTVWFAFTTNYIMLIVIHILYAFFGIATLWSAYLVAIRSIGSEKNQSTIYGSSEATRGIVQTMLGFVFLGIMGIAATPQAGFKTVLFVGAGVGLLLFILAYVFLPNDLAKSDVSAVESVSGAVKKYTLKDVLKHRGVWIVTLLIAGSYVVWSIGNGYLTTYTVQVLGISEALASTIGIIRSYVIVFLAGFIGGWLLDRFTFKGMGFFVLLSIVIASIVGVMLSSMVLPVCVVFTLIIAFVVNCIKSTYWSTLGQAGIPLEMTGMVTGVLSFIAYAPEFVVNLICGAWLDSAVAAGDVSAGFTKIFILLIVFAVISIIGSILLTRETKNLRSSVPQ